MPTFLEAFYYGRIDPQKREYRKGDIVTELSKRIHEIEQQMIKRYSNSEEERDILFDFIDNHTELTAHIEKDSFIAGFQLGARFACDTFEPSSIYIREIFEDRWK